MSLWNSIKAKGAASDMISKSLKFDNDFTNYKIKGSLIGNKSFIINQKEIVFVIKIKEKNLLIN